MPTPAASASSPSDTSSSPQPSHDDLSLAFDMTMASDLSYLLSQNFGNPESSSSSSSESMGSQSGSPREWAPVVWPELPEDDSWKWTQMDLDIFPNHDGLVVNPNALHLNPVTPITPIAPHAVHLQLSADSQPLPQDLLDFSFLTTPDQALIQPTRPPGLDTVLRSLTPPDDSPPTSALIGDADDVSRRAREAAGVTIAIQANAPKALPSATVEDTSTQAPKLPIPRLVRPAPSRMQKSQLPPASTHTPTLTPAPSPPPTSGVVAPATSTGRPKTSHTTIERRYRTNLNARIMALRHAVPALRILDKDQFPNEIIDERGFVDGVRAARKASKASVLGKAVEYIRVLKRRELRLRRESAGLKSLISGLVGGPALLKEWEAAWTHKYGGQEQDELLSDSDGDDDDGEDVSEDEDEKPRKKPKVVKDKPIKLPKATPNPSPPTGTTIIGPDGEITGKRKRGRPRKVVSPPESTMVMQTAPPQDGGKYLLAVFLFFSFFKPPVTTAPTSDYTAPHATHLGRVLSSSGLYNTTSPTTSFALAPTPVTWSEIVHHIHTFVSAFIIISLFVPLIPKAFRPLSFLGLFSRTGSPSQRQAKKDPDVLGSESSGVVDVVREASRAIRRANRTPAQARAWSRIAQSDLSRGSSLSVIKRLHTSLALSNSLPVDASASELATLALLTHPLSSSISASFWSRASAAACSNDAERAILQLDLSEANKLYKEGSATSNEQRPLIVAAQTLIMTTLRDAITRVFVSTASKVISAEETGFVQNDDGVLQDAFEQSAEVLELAKSLSGPVKQLSSVWDSFCRDQQRTGSDACDLYRLLDTLDHIREEREEPSSSSENDVLALLRALILLTATFPTNLAASTSGLDTPTPYSKPNPRSKPHLDLRRVLASSVFDRSEEVEDARDRVVDYLSLVVRSR